MIYQLLNKPTPQSMECVLRKNDDNSFTVLVCTKESSDYQAFLKYQEEGGKVYGADEEIPVNG